MVPATSVRADVPASAPVQVNVGALGLNIPGDAANESSIAVDPTAPNRIAIGWRQFDSVSSNFREAGYAYSADGGRTWTFPGVLQNGVFRSDPVLGSLSDGTLLYYSLISGFTCDLWRSATGGATWGAAVPAAGGDKAWFTTDKSGRASDGHVYASWSTAAGPFTATPFIRSTNGGLSFEPPIAMPNPPRWGTLSVGPGAELYVAGIQSAPFDPTTILVARSASAQNAMAPMQFEQTSVIDLGGALTFGAAPNPGGLLGQVWVDVDRSSSPLRGAVYVLSSVDPRIKNRIDDPQDVHFVRSLDGGATWSDPIRVNDDPLGNNAWQWFGTMAVAPNGRIDVVWNDTRDSGVPTISRLYYSSSSDGGVTWSSNQALTAAWNSTLGWPQQNKIGDYYHLVADNVGADLAFAATFNGEQDVWYLRIGDRDCDGNGIGDTIDLADGTLADCNSNGIPDACEIAAGTVPDLNGDGIPDGCPLSSDLNRDGVVDANDLAILLGAWLTPAADLNSDGTTDAADLGILLGAWD